MSSDGGAPVVETAILAHELGNVGHALMATGVESILATYPGRRFHTTRIQQHTPFDVYRPWSPARALNVLAQHPTRVSVLLQSNRITAPLRTAARSPRAAALLGRLASGPGARALWRVGGVRQFDLVVACGGPNVVPAADRSPDVSMIQVHQPGAFSSRGTPVAFVGVGACYPLERIPDEPTPTDAAWLRAAAEAATVVTVRDPLAQRLFAAAGVDVPLVPCNALLSTTPVDGDPAEADTILVNYQRFGANTDWGQGVDPERWRRELRAAIDELGKDHRIVLVCHDDPEERLAAELAPELPVERIRSAADYQRVASRARAAVVNRLHAAVPLAGAGVASLVVGTDSRLQTAEVLGLETAYAKEATTATIVDAVTRLSADVAGERSRLRAVVDATRARYHEVIGGLLA